MIIVQIEVFQSIVNVKTSRCTISGKPQGCYIDPPPPGSDMDGWAGGGVLTAVHRGVVNEIVTTSAKAWQCLTPLPNPASMSPILAHSSDISFSFYLYYICNQ